jgi:DNA-binding beta-propeller fold protein YncE
LIELLLIFTVTSFNSTILSGFTRINEIVYDVVCPDLDEPEAIAVNSTGTLVYFANEGDDTLWVVDVASQDCDGPIELDDSTSCSGPENMVISPDDSTLYITCAGSSVISVDTNSFDVDQIATGLTEPSRHCS